MEFENRMPGDRVILMPKVTIPEEIIDAVQRANHYALDDALIRRVLEPALKYLYGRVATNPEMRTATPSRFDEIAKGEKK